MGDQARLQDMFPFRSLQLLQSRLTACSRLRGCRVSPLTGRLSPSLPRGQCDSWEVHNPPPHLGRCRQPVCLFRQPKYRSLVVISNQWYVLSTSGSFIIRGRVSVLFTSFKPMVNRFDYRANVPFPLGHSHLLINL